MSKTERCQDCAGFDPSLNLAGKPTGFGSCTRGRRARNLKASVRRSCGIFVQHQIKEVREVQGDNFILTKLGGGLGYTLADTDMWGLECALQHGLQDGYFKDNRAWAEKMLNEIIRLREPGGQKV